MDTAASPRSAARIASTPAGALDAVRRCTPQAAMVRSGRAPLTPRSRAGRGPGSGCRPDRGSSTTPSRRGGWRAHARSARPTRGGAGSAPRPRPRAPALGVASPRWAAGARGAAESPLRHPRARAGWLPAAADVAAARALAAERVGEGLRADLEGRAQERHAVGAEVEAVHRDPHAVPAPAAGVERDEGAAAAVAEAPAGEDRALEPAPP